MRPDAVWIEFQRLQAPGERRVVLEKISIDDDREPFFNGKGEFRFHAKVWTPDNGGLLKETRLPEEGHFHLSDLPGSNEVRFDAVLFENWVEGKLAIQIGGLEFDTFDPDDRLDSFKHVFRGDPANWFGHYAPTGEAVDPQDMEGWKLWFRVEPA